MDAPDPPVLLLEVEVVLEPVLDPEPEPVVEEPVVDDPEERESVR